MVTKRKRNDYKLVKKDILSYNLDKLTDEISFLGEKRFRAKQIYEWLHVKNATDFNEMTNIPLSFRIKLDAVFYINCVKIVRRLESHADNTVKYLYGLADGNHIESVLMDYRHGSSLCVSTQVGCGMGCVFCASGASGFYRDLEPSEMLSQIYEAERDGGRRVDGAVLMGIGEPLNNFDNVMLFLEMLSFETGKNMSLRRVSVSTCGIVPRIYELAKRRLGLTLSVSLHTCFDEKRDKLMPVNKKYKIAELIKACRFYYSATGRRVSFEYAVMAGENNRTEDADGLSLLLKGFNCHINLMPVNGFIGRDFRAARSDCENFLSLLADRGLNATIRRTLGADINAGCGQLVAQRMVK
jgi:23S rRNA (adenine2503-C2)-methyltransferase